MNNKDLKYLKRHYGENFAHLCRSLFPTLLEQEGLLSKIIFDHFGHSRSLYNDILPLQDSFKSYIYSFVNVEKDKPEEIVIKSPTELLDEAGYILFPECQTEEDIQSFRKYWRKGEELCTFNGGRLNSCRVWFAVKKNIDEIKRKVFKNPQRQDEYGTSVISIQFSRGKNSTLSIKNRYNHTVNNPDSTFSNNLDNIIPGLTQSFIQTYGISMMNTNIRNFDIDGYRLANDGKFYKVNLEKYDICFCENNIVLVHGKVVELDKSRYILAENYLIDRKENDIVNFGEKLDYNDSFVESFGKIKEISTKKDENGNKIIVFTPKVGENIELTLSESNAIIGLNNPNVTQIGDYFLYYNRKLTNLTLQKLTKIGENFLDRNTDLRNLILPKLSRVGGFFLASNNSLKNLSLPNLTSVGNYFLASNDCLSNLSLPKLKKVEDRFLIYNASLTNLELPSLKEVKNKFLHYNTSLINLTLPNLEEVGRDFLYFNKSLIDLSSPKLKRVGENFLKFNKSLKGFYAPELENCPKKFKKVIKRTSRKHDKQLKKAENEKNKISKKQNNESEVEN